ncbi:hypothetical protein [Amycolatopsis arida]|uniref:hypothetical protein n=1 Tax=Amycolatopsis arida TaxID=587909 RepID=UPI001064DBE6|nr:hypothetical protein [Amycolatopsis arida]TDX84948.1 hypothetical protein CLV69_11732 [Amycolatopsis arida]
MARKVARDAGWGWAAAVRKADRRLADFADELARARELGTLPGVLDGFIREAAERAGVAPHDVPAEVWRAAGLNPTQAPQGASR